MSSCKKSRLQVCIIWFLGFLILTIAHPQVCLSQKKLPKSYKYDYLKNRAPKDLIQLIEKGNWYDKGSAAYVFAHRDDVSLDEKLRILTGNFKNELMKPSTNIAHHGGLCPEEECTRAQFQNALAAFGKPAVNKLKNEVKSLNLLSSAYKQHIVIVLGLIGDKSVMKDLLTLIVHAKNGYVRARAIRSLVTCCSVEAKNEKVLSILTKALKDSFFVKLARHSMMPEIDYPVRVEAAATLSKLGVHVEMEGFSYNYKIIK